MKKACDYCEDELIYRQMAAIRVDKVSGRLYIVQFVELVESDILAYKMMRQFIPWSFWKIEVCWKRK